MDDFEQGCAQLGILLIVLFEYIEIQNLEGMA
jgi:hypothetical protein